MQNTENPVSVKAMTVQLDPSEILCLSHSVKSLAITKMLFA